MQTVRNGECVLHVRVEGPADGRPVMFGNSLGTDMRVWDAMLPHLPEGLRLIRYDKRGHGLSDCPTGPYSIEMLSDDAAAVIDALDVGPVTFVGLSIGGLIGHGLAHGHGDKIKALALMDTAVRIGSPELWAERVVALRADGMAAMVEAILDRWFTAAARQDPLQMGPWRNMLLNTPLEGYIGCSQAIARADFTSGVRDLSLPIVAMAGEEDKATTPELVRETAALYRAGFHLIEKAGHLPCVEQPEDTARVITEFLKETADA